MATDQTVDLQQGEIGRQTEGGGDRNTVRSFEEIRINMYHDPLTHHRDDGTRLRGENEKLKYA